MARAYVIPYAGRMTRLFSLLLLSALLSGCGIKGSLATPEPLFGSQAPKDVVDADPLVPELAEDGEESPEEEPFYGPDFDDPLSGDRE